MVDVYIEFFDLLRVEEHTWDLDAVGARLLKVLNCLFCLAGRLQLARVRVVGRFEVDAIVLLLECVA